MKTALARIALALTYFVVVLVSGNVFGRYGGVAWDVFWSVAFAVAAMRFARSPAPFVLSGVFAVTLVMPFAILYAMARRTSPSADATLSLIAHTMTISDAVLDLLPLLVVAAVVLLQQRSALLAPR